MLSENLRARLERLNRQALPSEAARQGVQEAESYLRAAREERTSGRFSQLATTATNAAASRKPVAMAGSSPTPSPPTPSAMLSGEVVATSAGEHWFIRHRVDEFWPAFAARYGAWNGAWRAQGDTPDVVASPRKRATARARRYAAEVALLGRALPLGTLFLDLETCGLAGSALFLVGLLRHDGDHLVLEQLLARNYAEEQAVLHTLWRAAAQASLLVTFNGKSFDWPLVQDRSTYHRMGRDDSAPPMVELPHVDVLHHARRRWRQRLPDCRLQTLERFLCGRHRSGDIPGRDIPEAYRRYVATGRIDEMQAILHHNALDLVTLLELAMRLAAPVQRVASEITDVHDPARLAVDDAA